MTFSNAYYQICYKSDRRCWCLYIKGQVTWCYRIMTETGHSDSIAENSELSLRGDFIKKYWSSGGVFCYQTSLIRHGRVNSKGPLLQRSSTESPKTLTISSKPLVLDIRPLSDYQQTLIDTILRLRSEGWLDRQIANHFNAIGSLTPRGHRWLPQSVYSMRKKYERRLARIGEIWLT